ncbi:hypothetical protein BN2476_310046 [Paraburkholderia piptadeniae]|uniref:Uncharacterized protein n=1 Tax=Paraburkholderia piptadeniae TaxID=1701573 RepID=A0A1N7S3W0_9BURK|nr:hypothetical protein BN2476_310046 [Paraburkholderia piptadeniae]
MFGGAWESSRAQERASLSVTIGVLCREGFPALCAHLFLRKTRPAARQHLCTFTSSASAARSWAVSRFSRATPGTR